MRQKSVNLMKERRKQQNDTNMCPRHLYTPGTKGLRIVGVLVMTKWRSRVVDRQKETTKNR